MLKNPVNYSSHYNAYSKHQTRGRCCWAYQSSHWTVSTADFTLLTCYSAKGWNLSSFRPEHDR